MSTAASAEAQIDHTQDYVASQIRNNPYPDVRLEDPSKQIRLMRILPGTSDQAVCCELLTRQLESPHEDSNGDYEALSYVWGPFSGKRIVLCGLNYEVTDNLFNALRRLRGKESTKLLWIDAICINQPNLKERNAQIGKMCDIYHSACSVIVWLGEPASNDFTYSDLNIIITLTMHGTKAWWRRTWTVQEIVVSKVVSVLYGDVEMSWTQFVDIFETISGVVTVPRERKVGIVARDSRKMDSAFSIALASLRAIRQGHIGTPLPNSLRDWLLRAQARVASDPRDKVFGILGLVDKPDKFYVVPDYSRAVEQVYTEAVFSNIMQEHTLDILTEAWPHSFEDHPWIPDFSAPPSQDRLIGLDWISRSRYGTLILPPFPCAYPLTLPLVACPHWSDINSRGCIWDSSSIFSVLGIHVDQIRYVHSETLAGTNTYSDCFQHLKKLNGKRSDPQGLSLSHALWASSLFNDLVLSEPSSRWNSSIFDHCFRHISRTYKIAGLLQRLLCLELDLLRFIEAEKPKRTRSNSRYDVAVRKQSSKPAFEFHLYTWTTSDKFLLLEIFSISSRPYEKRPRGKSRKRVVIDLNKHLGLVDGKLNPLGTGLMDHAKTASLREPTVYVGEFGPILDVTFERCTNNGSTETVKTSLDLGRYLRLSDDKGRYFRVADRDNRHIIFRVKDPAYPGTIRHMSWSTQDVPLELVLYHGLGFMLRTDLESIMKGHPEAYREMEHTPHDWNTEDSHQHCDSWSRACQDIGLMSELRELSAESKTTKSHLSFWRFLLTMYASATTTTPMDWFQYFIQNFSKENDTDTVLGPNRWLGAFIMAQYKHFTPTEWPLIDIDDPVPGDHPQRLSTMPQCKLIMPTRQYPDRSLGSREGVIRHQVFLLLHELTELANQVDVDGPIDSSPSATARMFCTENGLLGFGPCTAQPGDEIAVAPGARTPYVLRKDGNYTRIVGEAVVDGLMDERIFRAHEKNLERFPLVDLVVTPESRKSHPEKQIRYREPVSEKRSPLETGTTGRRYPTSPPSQDQILAAQLGQLCSELAGTDLK